MDKRPRVTELEALIESIRIARWEMKRFAKATKYARKQQRKLLKEGDV